MVTIEGDNMAITEKEVSKLLIQIEKKCREAGKKRTELDRLKKQIIAEPVEEKVVLTEELDNTIKTNIQEEYSFDDEISFYLDNYKKLDDQFTYDDVISILPTKDSYDYEDIVNRLIAESYKEIKEINELLLDDQTIGKEELLEFKGLIEKEHKKIDYIRKSMIEEKETTVKEHKNKIVLVPTIGGNIRVIDELEHIPLDYYDSFLELINSIINGTFKNVKTFTSNSQLAGISEVKGFKTRVVFSRLDKNTYALITAFIKKSDIDKLYKDTLTRKVSHFKENESVLKKKINDPKFMVENDQYVEELFNLLNSKDNNKEYKKVNSND
mgnify:CR=1 FL=1